MPGALAFLADRLAAVSLTNIPLTTELDRFALRGKIYTRSPSKTVEGAIMSVGLESARPQEQKPPVPKCAIGCCPCCAGPLVPLRGSFRCGRCHYTFCIGCENDGSDGNSEDRY